MDEADRAQIITERELESLIAARRPNALAPVSHLNCTDCGWFIPPARRHAQPAATRCVSCQQQLENGQRDSGL